MIEAASQDLTQLNVRKDEVDIYQLPNKDSQFVLTAGSQITIGDLHSNAMKLIYMLIRHGVLEMSKEDYQELVNAYKNCIELEGGNRFSRAVITQFEQLNGKIGQNNLSAINKFIAIIEKATWHQIQGIVTLRLIGDEVADRGQCDYLILKILEKLKNCGVTVEILFSNHGYEFIQSYEKLPTDDSPIFFPCTLVGDQALSAKVLSILVHKNLISLNEIKKLIDEFYKPCLKALAYSLDLQSNCISIYMHAKPTDDMSRIIRAIAEHSLINVPYQDNTIVELAHTIDQINIKFQQVIITNKCMDLVESQRQTARNIYAGGGSLDYDYDVCLEPFKYISWNRGSIDPNKKRPSDHHAKGYEIRVVYGHTPEDSSTLPRHIYNLDNTLGKYLDTNTGEYYVLYSHQLGLQLSFIHSIINYLVDSFKFLLAVNECIPQHNTTRDFIEFYNSAMRRQIALLESIQQQRPLSLNLNKLTELSSNASNLIHKFYQEFALLSQQHKSIFNDSLESLLEWKAKFLSLLSMPVSIADCTEKYCLEFATNYQAYKDFESRYLQFITNRLTCGFIIIPQSIKKSFDKALVDYIAEPPKQLTIFNIVQLCEQDFSGIGYVIALDKKPDALKKELEKGLENKSSLHALVKMIAKCYKIDGDIGKIAQVNPIRLPQQAKLQQQLLLIAYINDELALLLPQNDNNQLSKIKEELKLIKASTLTEERITYFKKLISQAVAPILKTIMLFGNPNPSLDRFKQSFPEKKSTAEYKAAEQQVLQRRGK